MHGHVAGAFVHDLHAVLPGALGQVALRLQLGELRLVVRIGNAAGAQAVADGKADIVRGHDLANVVPMGVEEIFLVMGEAPLGEDAAAARDDAGGAPRGEGNEPQQDAGVDGEIIDALLRLLDERVAKNLPGQFLGAAVHFFERLVNRDGADGHGRIAEDPLAGGVDVLAGGEVHHGVGAPFCGPAHFFHLLLDARRDGGVADVRVDLHQEIAADDHRLGFGMVDVRRDDGAPAGNFVADKFRGDEIGDALRELAENAGGIGAGRGAGMTLEEGIARLGVGEARAEAVEALVFADGDELHLRRHDALAGVPKLGDGMALRRAQRLAARGLREAVGAICGRGIARVGLREETVVARGDGAAVVFDHVGALQDPWLSQRRQALLDVAMESGIAPRPAGVVDADRVVRLDGAGR